jgi:hypothetical protein
MIGETFVQMRNGASDRVAAALARARKDPSNRKRHMADAAVASLSFSIFRDRHHAFLRANGISPVTNYSS